MTTQTANAPFVTDGGRQALTEFQHELITCCRHLPQLLEEGEQDRYVVIQGETLLDTWDTYRDALQHGYHCCGDEKFLVHRITSRDLEEMERILRQEHLWTG